MQTLKETTSPIKPIRIVFFIVYPYASLLLESPVGLLFPDIVFPATEGFADKLPVLIHLEGVTDGSLDRSWMEEPEPILTDFVVGRVGDPALEGV